MSSRRSGERGQPPPFRSKRVCQANGQWYFDTREGAQFGPFQSEDEANKALAFFVALNVYDSQVNRSGNKSDESGAQDGISHMVQEVLGFLRFREENGQLAALAWAKSRVKELAKISRIDPAAVDCIGVLKFAMSQAERPFDFGLFLENRA